ncbi:DUF3993 domain-containing protein [Bacillus sp. V3]|uniref:DUF3993 domain-containing protein n=1 Tax=[Bacillus] enclensis TaxID=1402860 RepID=UPI000509DFF1|nr:DUF3993 domain-containing protein [[Bacillus] enclensis]MBH9968396.1 DUF3993 domain-containing protein [[Bacillus] enclensis]QTC42233.1 DUF3993 domain-containing protein [Bacillus sp. V3]QWC24298.1 DUF3993 domain-containing protein [Bacillus haikouensis]
MAKSKLFILVLIIGLVSAACGQVKQTQASTFTDKQAMAMVKEAFQTQVSLSEKPQPMEDIEKQLNESFTEELTNSFIEDNVVMAEGGYMTFGSDFAPHYIPFFSYDKSTNVDYENGKWYIWEERTGEDEGPVSTASGVEAVVLTKEKGNWKVASITNEIPDHLK